ncbi:translation initiation factor IF-2-like [Schistocerca piceifrons]|uniref:translation initiation factor IF-2-like n=1 Tax=Schistocerca piceifrons TaxID=274613 RepID=UPI001F5F52C2|nr:translation initiation factor IF-2-like [Schistocerca piceifrons]
MGGGERAEPAVTSEVPTRAGGRCEPRAVCARVCVWLWGRPGLLWGGAFQRPATRGRLDFVGGPQSGRPRAPLSPAPAPAAAEAAASVPRPGPAGRRSMNGPGPRRAPALSAQDGAALRRTTHVPGRPRICVSDTSPPPPPPDKGRPGTAGRAAVP